MSIIFFRSLIKIKLQENSSQCWLTLKLKGMIKKSLSKENCLYINEYLVATVDSGVTSSSVWREHPRARHLQLYYLYGVETFAVVSEVLLLCICCWRFSLNSWLACLASPLRIHNTHRTVENHLTSPPTPSSSAPSFKRIHADSHARPVLMPGPPHIPRWSAASALQEIPCN